MQFRDVMRPDVEVVRADATLQEAARRMKVRKSGCLSIRDGEQSLGIVTDRNMTVRAVAEGRGPTATTVREIMSPVILCCFEDDDVTAAVRCIQEQQIQYLAVLDRHRRVVGVVSLYALALQTRDEGLAGTAIRWPA